MKLYSPATVKQIIDKYKFHFQKSLGQNFLIDGNIINKIVGSANINNQDVVLEIGPGIGTLTCALADKAAKVIVIELDKNLIVILKETLAGYNNIEVISGDALKTNFDEIVSAKTDGQYGLGAKSYKVVANLPYYITTPLIMHAMESRFNIDLMVFMIQKEVAARMVAPPGSKDYGALTLGVGYYSEPQLVARVPKKVFMPQPEVESTVVSLKILDNPPVPVEREEVFFQVVRAAFGQRRKTLINALTGGMEGLDKNQIGQALSILEIDPERRGETLSFQEFASIANLISRNKTKE